MNTEQQQSHLTSDCVGDASKTALAGHTPGPWEVTPGSRRSTAKRPFWNVTRPNPGKLGGIDYVRTPMNDMRRWYDKGEAEKVAASLNAALAKAGVTP